MKILMYEPVVNPGSRGYLIHVQELVHNLARLGHEVMLVSQIGTWPYETVVSLRTVKRLRFLPFVISYSLLAPHATLSAVTACLRWRPDVIYTRVGMLGGVLLSKLYRRPLVTEVNGLIREELQTWPVRLSLPHRVFAWMTERDAVHSDHVVAVTPGIKESLGTALGIARDRITVIPNGANTDLFKPMDTQRARAELDLPDNLKYVCFVGSLAGWQGVDYLIQCAPLVLQRCPEARFVIVGDGSTKDELVTLARQLGVSAETTFVGSVPYDVVPLYVNASELCVAPKRVLKSGYSTLKLFEYMACGKPVIATRTAGFEILETYHAGLLVNPEDPVQFAEAILGLLGNDALRKQMGENGRKYAVENHSWRSVAERVARVCQQVVKARSR